MNVTSLLRESMKTKPASNRGARQKTSTPKDVTRMNYNENPYGMSPATRQAMLDAVDGSFMYQDFFAVDMKDRLADFYGLTRDHILIGSGSSSIIDMLGEVFLNYGDEVVYGDPSYEAFPDMISDNGGVRVPVALDENYRFDLDAMRAAVTPKTKMVIVVNPNNPTGTYVKSAKVDEFVRSLPGHVLAVVDEAYCEYVTDPEHYSLFRMVRAGYDKPLIVLRTFSKVYGLAGMRVGYAAADPQIIDQLMKACQAWNVGRNALLAAEAALRDQAYVQKMRALNEENRRWLAGALRKLGCAVVEPAANFIYFDPRCDAQALRRELAERKIMIGAPDRFSRVTVGTPEQNQMFIRALGELLERLRPQSDTRSA